MLIVENKGNLPSLPLFNGFQQSIILQMTNDKSLVCEWPIGE